MEIKKTATVTSDKETLASFLLKYKTIECLGMQGSGKTTLTHWLHDKYNMEIVTASTDWRTSWKRFALFFCLKHVFLILWWTVTALVESLRVRKPRLFFHKINLMLVLAARWEYLHKLYPEGVRLLDEGFMQAILSLYEHPVSHITMQQTLQRFPSSDCVVYLDSNFPAVGLGKVSNRRLALGQDYVLQWKSTFTRNLTTLIRVIEERSQTELVKVVDDPTI